MRLHDNAPEGITIFNFISSFAGTLGSMLLCIWLFKIGVGCKLGGIMFGAGLIGTVYCLGSLVFKIYREYEPDVSNPFFDTWATWGDNLRSFAYFTAPVAITLGLLIGAKNL